MNQRKVISFVKVWQTVEMLIIMICLNYLTFCDYWQAVTFCYVVANCSVAYGDTDFAKGNWQLLLDISCANLSVNFTSSKTFSFKVLRDMLSQLHSSAAYSVNRLFPTSIHNATWHKCSFFSTSEHRECCSISKFLCVAEIIWEVLATLNVVHLLN